jgi:hypothetical protein
MALLLECTEIKDLPVYNKALKRFEQNTDCLNMKLNGYRYLATGKIRVALKLLTLFMTE